MSASSFTSLCYVIGFLVIISVIFNAFWYVMIPLVIVIALMVMCLIPIKDEDSIPTPTFRERPASFRPPIPQRPEEPSEERRLRDRVRDEWERQSHFGNPEDLR